MKKSELRQIIKEEITKALKEDTQQTEAESIFGGKKKQFAQFRADQKEKGKIMKKDNSFRDWMFEIYKDVSQGLIITAPSPNDPKDTSVYVDENGKYKYLLTGKFNKGANEIGYSDVIIRPKSELSTTPFKIDFSNFYRIVRPILQSGLNGDDWTVVYYADLKGTGAKVKIGEDGYLVETSKFKRDDPNYGFPKEIGSGISWVDFTFRY
jgi:hypothetical protein